ncbi:MAG: Holliday junction resolvase RuvX [Oscillospiraceae bacterium]
MKIMSVDYGDSRTGIALCDATEILAYPHTVIFEKKYLALANKIMDIAVSCDVDMIVVGNPKNMDGSDGQRSKKSQTLASLLKRKLGIDVQMFDERMTTVTATNILNDVNVTGKKRKNVIDAVAATVILETFLNFRKNNN